MSLAALNALTANGQDIPEHLTIERVACLGHSAQGSSLWRSHFHEPCLVSLHGGGLLRECNSAEDSHKSVSVLLWRGRWGVFVASTLADRHEEQLAENEEAVPRVYEP